MAKVLVFDLETRLGPKDLQPNDEEAGWEALRRGEGGISAICVYDVDQKWLYIYDDQSIEKAVRHMESADVLVGYCTESFDIPCLEGALGRKMRIKQHYDIYTEIKVANAKKGIIGRKGDFTLGSVCQRCFGRGKTDHGGNVVELLRAGKVADVFNYCSQDVKLTYDLMMYVCEHGGIQSINNSFLAVPVADWLKKSLL